MGLPLKYSLLSPRRRRLTTSLTAAGIALVVVLYVVVYGLADGLAYVFASTGRSDNLIILRSGTANAGMSRLSEELIEALRYQPGIARDEAGEPLLSPELAESLYLATPDGARTPVTVRGVDPVAYRVHDGLEIVDGRIPGELSDEAVLGTALARRAGLATGSTISVGGTDWRVVGLFDSGGDAFESEIWVDRHSLLGRRMRSGAGYAVARIEDGDETAVKAVEEELESSAWLGVRAGAESQYYERANRGASKSVARMCRIMVAVMGFAMVVTGMNTMYTLIAARRRELGTLRVIGFKPRDLLWAVLVESAVIGLAGGLAGGLVALVARGVSVVYQGVTLRFRIGPELVIEGLVLAAVIGVIGGILPAIRAARLEVVETLRAL